jgi:NAD(P)-dependent dehydrogenase (short-subunit alcohol dehydrogenase family)
MSKALVTGGASGIGRAIVDRLETDDHEVVVVDVADDPSLDVAEPATWERIVSRLDGLDIACLNAGVVTGVAAIVDLSDEAYRRILRVNVDGVVFGVRALTPLLERSGGGDVVVTASLAGLTTMANDPIYAGTKHFLVGFVRSVAPQLEVRGVRINAVCPGIVATPLLGDEGRARLEESGFPLLRPEDVAEAVAAVLAGGETGQAWVCQPGREPEPYQFRGVPGPRVEGAEGLRPPL